MKKLLLSLAALIMVCVGVNAKTKNAVFGTPAGQGAWDATNEVYSWTASYSNLVTIFDCNTDNLTNYTSLHLTTSNLVDGPYRVCFMNGSTAVATIAFYSAGQKDLVFAERSETKDIDLSQITHISFGGASGEGSVKVQNVYLEGPDRPATVGLSTEVGKNVKSLTGTNTNWSNTVNYPMAFETQGASFGDGDGGSEATHVDITGYSKLSFYVSKGSDKGLAVRVWIWDGTKVVTLYLHPDADYATADFSQPYEISEPGVYSVKIAGYEHLKGVKAANKWEGQTGVVVEYAWLSNGEAALAVDEARTYSSMWALDFSSVTDVDAYIATAVSGSSVTMQKVTGSVPANTGLVLIDNSGKNYVNIPTCDTATEDVSSNLLVATTASTTVSSGYVLAGAGSSLGWYSINSVQPTLAAGKAYLNATASVKALTMSFDDITAIQSVDVKPATEGAYYSLQGIRVANPEKGIYIKNGKKVIVK